MRNSAALGVGAIAKAIMSGRLSSQEATSAHLQRIEALNASLNAVVLRNDKAAMQAARNADKLLAAGKRLGPLHGVPITIKEAYDIAGWQTSSSYKPLMGNIARTDATAVARLKAAGAVILGKTNVPELCMDVQSNSPVYSEAANPWNLACTPGRSTGGGAAAVAARLSPLELGSDIGGSVRIPAHFCGVYGLKTSEWRIPATGHVPDLPGRPHTTRYMGTFGFLARNVADLRLGLQICAGPDGIDIEVPPVPLEPAPKIQLKGLRLAWIDQVPLAPTSSDTGAVLHGLLKRLARAGVKTRKAAPVGLDYEASWSAWSQLIAYMARMLDPLEARERFFHFADSDNPSRRAVAKAARLDMAEYAGVLAFRDATIARTERFLDDFDCWMMPVAVIPAFTRRKSGLPLQVDGKDQIYWVAATAFSHIANFTGQPVITIPAGFSKDGLPIGVQIIGKRWGEMKLLAVAEAIEKLLGPLSCPPGYDPD